MKRALATTALPVLGQVATLLATLIAIGILARLLEKADFGTYAYVLAIVTTLTLFFEASLYTVCLRGSPLTPKQAWTVLLLGLGGLALVGLAAIPLMAMLGSGSGPTGLMAFVYASASLRAISAMPHAVLRQKGKVTHLVIVETLAAVIGLALVPCLLANMSAGIWSLAFGLFAQALVRLIGFAPGWPKMAPSMEGWPGMKPLLRLGSGSGSASTMNYLGQNVTSIVMLPLLGPVALGVYSQGYRIAAIPLRLYDAIHQMFMFPAMAAAGTDRVRLCRAAETACLASLFAGTAISAGCLLASHEIVAVLLGPDWRDAVPVLQFLLLSIPARLLLRSCEGAGLLDGDIVGPPVRYALMAGMTCALLLLFSIKTASQAAAIVSTVVFVIAALSLHATIRQKLVQPGTTLPACLVSIVVLTTSFWLGSPLPLADSDIWLALSIGAGKALAGAAAAASVLWLTATTTCRTLLKQALQNTGGR